MSGEMKLYVGNLSWKVTEDNLREHFKAYGVITDCVVIMDRETGRPRGFGFVIFENLEDAKAVIDGLNGTELQGRSIRVAVAADGGGGGGRHSRRSGGGRSSQEPE